MVRQRGAAIVTAILIVAIVTVIVSGLFWREHVAVRSIENRLALAQTQWIERVAIDWTRVALRVDGAQSQKDDLQEIWAQPIAATRADETVLGGSRVGDPSRAATLTGQAIDAQSRLNLNNMLPGTERQLREASIAAFRKLLDLNGLPTALADVLATRLATTVDQTGTDGRVVPATSLPLVRVDDLRTLREFDTSVINLLRDQVVFLPRSTPVNLNTASGTVIAAVIPSLQREDAMRFVNQKRREYPNTSAALAQIKDGAAPSVTTMVSVNSGYFLVRGVVRYDRVDAQTETLIERSGNRVTVVWQQRS